MQSSNLWMISNTKTWIYLDATTVYSIIKPVSLLVVNIHSRDGNRNTEDCFLQHASNHSFINTIGRPSASMCKHKTGNSKCSKNLYISNVPFKNMHSCHISRRETKSHGFSAVFKSHAVRIVSHGKWNNLPFCCNLFLPPKRDITSMI